MTRPDSTIPPLIGQSPPIQAMLDRVSALAPVDRPVLIVGERGTGKELVAARLHYLSRRWQRPTGGGAPRRSVTRTVPTSRECFLVAAR